MSQFDKTLIWSFWDLSLPADQAGLPRQAGTNHRKRHPPVPGWHIRAGEKPTTITGYAISELPSPSLDDDQLVKLEYLTEMVGDKLKVTGTVIFKYAVYPAEAYPMLKNLFDTMIAKFQEVVILKPL